MYHTIACLVGLHVVANHGISVVVAAYVLAQRTPCAQVAPTETGRETVYLLRLLEDGIVNRDTLALGEVLVDGFLLLVRAVEGQEVLEHLVNLRRIHSEGIHYGADIPDEDAGIPKHVGLADVLLGRGKVGLLAEGVHTIDLRKLKIFSLLVT